MTKLAKFLMFLSSFFPAYLMMAAISLFTSGDLAQYFGKVMLAAGAISPVLFLVVERAMLSRQKHEISIASIERKDDGVISYVIAYLPPFFSVNYGNEGHIIALMILYALLVAIYIRLDLYYINPIYVFRGYRTYRMVSSQGCEYIALAKDRLEMQAGDTIRCTKADGVVLVDETDISHIDGRSAPD